MTIVSLGALLAARPVILRHTIGAQDLGPLELDYVSPGDHRG